MLHKPEFWLHKPLKTNTLIFKNADIVKASPQTILAQGIIFFHKVILLKPLLRKKSTFCSINGKKYTFEEISLT